MKVFKKKSKKDPKSDPRKNIITLHEEKNVYFNNLQKSLPEKKKKLEILLKKKDTIIVDVSPSGGTIVDASSKGGTGSAANHFVDNNKVISNGADSSVSVSPEGCRYFEIQDLDSEIEHLKKSIKSIENKEEENNYLLSVFHILRDYSGFKSNSNGVSSTEDDNNPVSSPKVVPSKMLAPEGVPPLELASSMVPPEDILYTGPAANSFGDINSIESGNNKVFKYGDLTNFVEVEEGSKKSKFLEEYLRKTEKYYYNKDPECKYFKYPTECSECRSTLVNENLTEDLYICVKCGMITETGQLDFAKPGFKELQEISFTPNFCYRRITHFNEILSQIQAKETTLIPQYIVDNLKIEMKKENLLPKNLKPSRIKRYLKKIGESKHYEHTMYIIYLLGGSNPKTMSIQMEEKLRRMFNEIQKPFDRFCPDKRKNFLNYNYILHKFCQLLHYDEFIPYFPLLKSREKLYQHDQIWKKICNELNYEFIASI